MALPASGYKSSLLELLFVECDGFSITIKGPLNHPKADRLQLHQNVESDVRIQGRAYRSLKTPYGSSENETVVLPGPLFFEETEYELVVEQNSSSPTVQFWHRDLGLRSGYGPVGRSGKISSAIINFHSQVGYSELLFLQTGKTVLSLTIEVFPTKIDYRRDWETLLERISESLYSLAYGFLSSTFQHGRATPQATKTLGQWYALLEPRFDELLLSLDTIARSPSRKIVRQERVRPLALARRPDSSVRRWIMRHPACLQPIEFKIPGAIPTPAGDALPTRVPESKARLSYDTRENRFVKWLISDINRRLGRIEESYAALCSGPFGPRLDREFLNRLKTQQSKLRSRLQYDFLSEAGPHQDSGTFSTVLQFAPGYRNVFELGSILQLGLAFADGIERIDLKSVHELYEIWCFLELDVLLSELTVAKRNARTPFANNQLFWGLVRDGQGGAHYTSELGDEILLRYNFSQFTPTGSQRPDNLVSIEKRGAQVAFTFILDAKYKLALDDMHAGPMTEDINAMHRYRDALVTTDSRAARRITEAIVLFPWSDEAGYLDHRFYKSIDRVGVGALPFLPGNKSLVKALLSRWISEPAPELDDKAVGVEKHSRVGLVLLGPISPALSISDIQRIGFYHVPKSRLTLENKEVTHLALYESSRSSNGGVVRMLYPIERWTVVPRNQLDVPGIRKPSAELYYRIDLRIASAERLDPAKRRTTPWGVRSHRYIPLAVFDSTDVLDVMASDDRIAKIRLRVHRFVDFMRKAQLSSESGWSLEFRGMNRAQLKVIDRELVIIYTGGQSERLGFIDKAIPLAQVGAKIAAVIGLTD